MVDSGANTISAGAGLIPRLPRAAIIVLIGDAISALGQGMVLPFLLVYLHQVRGINIALAGLVLSTIALASFIGNPLGGWLSDPVGPRTTLIASLACSAVGVGIFAWATQPPLAFLAAALLGLGQSIAWPAFDSLLATLVAPRQRSAAFALRHATLNAGLAIGAVAAGLIVDTATAATFQTTYFVAVATILLFIPLLAFTPGRGQQALADDGIKASYRTVLSDRLFLSVVGLSAVVVTIGLGQYHAAFPGWATRDPGGIPTDALSACFAANAITVVVLQLPVLRALSGRKRTTAVSLALAGWAIAWLLALIFGHTENDGLALAGFIGAMVMFGIAETALSPTLPAIVNDLAPDHLRGRYNGVSALGWTTGFLLGPAVAGFALDAHAGAALLAGLIAACILGGIWALHLGRRLPPSTNRITTTSSVDES